jgi:ribA/ribD-fused uncharacterized protein
MSSSVSNRKRRVNDDSTSSAAKRRRHRRTDASPKASTPPGLCLFYATKSPFSNWHRARFNFRGRNYNCSEQALMVAKAELFGDTKAVEAIMSTSDPKIQKQRGREVRNFESTKWEAVAEKEMTAILMCKFGQCPELKRHLLATGDLTIAEASPNDNIWGIGLSARSKDVANKKLWGQNLLGKSLMKVRDRLQGKTAAA